ncbi:MAG: hypothetical protein FJ086_02040 [Deltaproteobacteria bacterium]|nr:hypothetical protein [Deltaproteobacteria bacterium]
MDLKEVAQLKALAAVEQVAPVRFTPDTLRHLLQVDLDTFGRFCLHADAHADHALRAAVEAGEALRAHCKDVQDNAAWRAFLRQPPRAALAALLAQPAHLGCGHVKRLVTHAEAYGVRPGWRRTSCGCSTNCGWRGRRRWSG